MISGRMNIISNKNKFLIKVYNAEKPKGSLTLILLRRVGKEFVTSGHQTFIFADSYCIVLIKNKICIALTSQEFSLFSENLIFWNETLFRNYLETF